jgi:hypothetical protein
MYQNGIVANAQGLWHPLDFSSTPISAERNSATIWDETAQFLLRKSDDLRRQG